MTALSVTVPVDRILSMREIEIMDKLIAGARITDIAEDLRISASTVSTYRHRILNKLKLRTNADLVRWATLQAV